MDILQVSPASRCEICHQTDRYDPSTNYCLRCANIQYVRLTPIVIETKASYLRRKYAKYCLYLAISLWATGLASFYGSTPQTIGLSYWGMVLYFTGFIPLVLWIVWRL